MREEKIIRAWAYCLLKPERVAKGIFILESQMLDWRGAGNPNPFAGWTPAFGLSECEEELLHSLTARPSLLARPVFYEFERAGMDVPGISQTRTNPTCQKTKKVRKRAKTKRRR